MRGLVGFIVVVAALVVGTVWLNARGGELSFTWGNLLIELPLVVAAWIVLVFGAVMALVYRVWRAIRRSPASLRDALGRRRRERGYQALTRGLVAVAAGDASEARRHARRADELLGHPPLTLLLAAQAAQLDGDRDAAIAHFNAMLERPETEFLGLRGLMVEALRRGDEDAARDYARRAHALRPDAGWAADALFGLQTRHHDWRDAQRTLEQAQDRKAVGAAEGRRRRAVVLTERARHALAELDRAEAKRLAREAHAEVPELIPATALLAGLLIDDEKLRPAAKIIERSWPTTPHPELAELYRRAGRDGGAALYRRMQKLVSLAPAAAESHLAAARAALDADLTGEARRHLEAAEERGPAGQRLARMWAELEEKDGHPERMQSWLRRAADAGPEPVWHCRRCVHVAKEWSAVCEACGAFDTMIWAPPVKEGVTPEATPDDTLLAVDP